MKVISEDNLDDSVLLDPGGHPVGRQPVLVLPRVVGGEADGVPLGRVNHARDHLVHLVQGRHLPTKT